jgi:hypothetical protein
LTLETFAALIQQDIARMATKDDISGLASKGDIKDIKLDIDGLKSSVRELHEDVRNMNAIMVSKADFAETLREELNKSEYAREVSELRTRVERLEEDLGIKHGRRAA